MSHFNKEGSITPSQQEDNYATLTPQQLTATKESKRSFGFSSTMEDLRQHWRVYILGICASFGGLLFGWGTSHSITAS